MNEPDMTHLRDLRSSLLGILQESTDHLKYLDKVEARSWKMHVVDPLSDVTRFVGNRIVDNQDR